jgi:DNA-binding NtrC family response regulator
MPSRIRERGPDARKGIAMVRILLVDDDVDLLFLIGEYLALRGIGCETAESASQARDKLEKSAFDVIISDFNMPRESGLDLFRSLSPDYSDIPFIIMSGSVDRKLKQHAIDIGVADFIEKPFVFRDLVDTVIYLAKSKARSSTGTCDAGEVPVGPEIAALNAVPHGKAEKRPECAAL